MLGRPGRSAVKEEMSCLSESLFFSRWRGLPQVLISEYRAGQNMALSKRGITAYSGGRKQGRNRISEGCLIGSRYELYRPRRSVVNCPVNELEEADGPINAR